MKMFNFFVLIIIIIFLTGCSKNVLKKNEIEEFDIKPNKSSKSIFDKVQWVKNKEINGVILYMQKNKIERNNHYKAEKIISSKLGEKLYKNLMDFNSLSKIFPKILISKKIKDISKNKYLMYRQTNFKPFKNRDYYIILEYSFENKNNIKEWTIEWFPLGSFSEKFSDNKNFIRVKDIYGRWKILESKNKTKISVEYFNDFNLSVPKGLSEPIEKSSTIDTLNQIIKYTIKQ